MAFDTEYLIEKASKLPQDLIRKILRIFDQPLLYIGYLCEKKPFRRLMNLYGALTKEVPILQTEVYGVNLFTEDTIKIISSIPQKAYIIGRCCWDSLVLGYYGGLRSIGLRGENAGKPSGRVFLEHQLVLKDIILPARLDLKKSNLIGKSGIFGFSQELRQDDLPIELWINQNRKYSVETLMNSQKIFKIKVRITKTGKVVASQSFKPKYGLNELIFVDWLTSKAKNDYIVFRIIKKKHMYDFIQVYSYRIFDLKRRRILKSRISQEGTFDNIREDHGTIFEDKLYLWDQKNSIVVYTFEESSADFIQSKKISVSNLCNIITYIVNFGLSFALKDNSTNYIIYLSRYNLIVLDVTNERSVCLWIEQELKGLEYEKCSWCIDERNREIIMLLNDIGVIHANSPEYHICSMNMDYLLKQINHKFDNNF